MATIEDLERRVIALEKAAERDKSVERAAAEVVAESEKRLTAQITGAETRLTDRVNSAERRMVDILNARFDEVLAALDRPRDPPA
jgi:hypothetical protein